MPFLGLILSFLPNILGGNLVEKWLGHKRAQLETASEQEKVRIEADIKVLEAEQQRRVQIKELQIKEYEHGFLWWPKFMIMMAVAFYWFAVFTHVTLGLADFNIVIPELTPKQEAVSVAVLTYMFLGNKIERVFTNLAGKK